MLKTLTEDQQTKVQAWATDNLHPCPNCGSDDYEVQIELRGLPLLSGDSTDYTIHVDRISAALAVNCPGCGLIQLFDAKHIGIS